MIVDSHVQRVGVSGLFTSMLIVATFPPTGGGGGAGSYTAVHFKDDEFDVATATTVEEAKELATTGFDYFTTMNGVQIFRKPKMFQKYRY